MKIEINKGTYNKTTTKNGITHIVDTSKEYTYYEVHMYVRYKDINSREELENKLKNDLKEIINAIDKERKER